MADDDNTNAEKKFKTWIHEVLDERETKAAADRTAAEEKRLKDEKDNPKPVGIIASLFGG
jgi:hypothetical protein